jgi:hypothetical protein
MNPNYGYQMYQAERVRTRQQILADDARRGQRAAAFSRGSRKLIRKARASLTMALGTPSAREAEIRTT